MANKGKVASEQEITNQETTEVIQHPAEYEQWIAQYKKVYTIECEDDNGVVQRMYIRNPDYELKKACILTLAKDPMSIATVGEMILATCVIGGFDMRKDDDMKLAAAFQCAELIEVKDTRLKKS